MEEIKQTTIENNKKQEEIKQTTIENTKKQEEGKQTTIKTNVLSFLEQEDVKKKISAILPKHLSLERLYRITYQAFSKTPKLRECTKESIINCLITLSQYGLEPDGRRAYLIPYDNRETGKVEAQLMLDYKGIIDIVMRSGQVKSIHADVVCANDEFETNLGKVLKHKINWGKERGEPIAVYCIVCLSNGEEKHEIMDWQSVLSIRNRSKTWLYAKDKANTPWSTDLFEMAKKTVFKRAAKWLIWDSNLREQIESDDDLIIDVEARTTLYDEIIARFAEHNISEDSLNRFVNEKGIYKGELKNAPEQILKNLLNNINIYKEVIK